MRSDGKKVILTTAIHRALLINNVVSQDYLLAIRPHNIKASRAPATHSTPSRVRLVENYGSEHVLHADYGNELVRVSVPPHFAAVNEEIQLVLDLRYAYLVEPASGVVISLASANSMA